jgi:hypothetical protein
MVLAQGECDWERSKLLVALREGVLCRFDIMIPWNIVRRIPRERKDGWNLMNGLSLFCLASLDLFEPDLDVDGLCLGISSCERP